MKRAGLDYGTCRRRSERCGRSGGQGTGLIQPDVEGVSRQTIATGAIGQRRHSDELPIDEAAKLARRLQCGGLGQIDVQPALRRRRSLGRLVTAGGEHEAKDHGGNDHAGNDHAGHDHPTGLLGRLRQLAAPHSHDAADSVDQALETSAKGIRALKISLLVLGATALALMLTIDRTLNAIWRVRRPRPMAQRVLVYWAALTLGPLLLGGSLTLTSYAVSVGQGLFTKMPGNLAMLLNGVDILLLGLAMAGLFHYVPNTHVRWRHALLGGAFVSVGFTLAKSLLAWYVKQVPTYSTLYGAFATVPVFLVWVYLGWVIVLLGAILAANTPSLTGRLHLRPDTPGQPMALALEVLRELWRVRQAGHQGVSDLGLARALRVDPLQLSPVVDKLLTMDWIGRLEENGAQRLVLLCAPEQVLAEPLLSTFLAGRQGLLGNLWQQGDWSRLTLDRLL